MEVLEEDDERLLIVDEDIENRLRFVRIRDKDFEDVESLVLDRPALVAEEHHDLLELCRGADVLCHDGEVGAIEEEFAEELERLALCDKVLRVQELRVALEELVVVAIEELRDDILVEGQ